ncbi:calcium-binding protein [Trichocoleus sp. FACHB-832]|uniref:beta strand repeat-containing protein n=1 Tax=Trichocoleus sp. FACHB-832 TaxID=2692875 RepID=UPI001683DFDD|nr:calcium-binding protein [Trichocoleus sp. FACHB-832]MBD1907163.1 calcium-binding protein [Trichocoleus sp. FACHB-832]
MAPIVAIASGTNPRETGSTIGKFLLTLSEPAPDGGLTINYTVATDLTAATPGVDYTALTGSITIAAGATTAFIDIVPLDDASLDPGETVGITLADGTGYTIGTANTASFTITDNDGTLGNDTLIGSDGNDIINGGAGNDSIDGGAGNDSIDGGDGNDILDGGEGADNLRGGNGNDVYIIDSPGDIISGEIEGTLGGWDKVKSSVSYQLGTGLEKLKLTGFAAISGTGNNFNNTIIGNNFNNQLTGLSGDDTLSGRGSDDRLDGGEGDDLLRGGDGNDTLIGGINSTSPSPISDNDILRGGEGNDTLDAGNGNDFLDGGEGFDILRGGNGSDVYIVDNTQDRIELETETAIGGIDRVESSVSWILTPGLENLTLTGFAPSSGTGNNLNNIIIGNDFDNQLWGNFGNDTLTGNGGIDRLDGGDGNDTLDGGDGNDTLIGGLNSPNFLIDNDILRGGEGNDLLDGGAGNDLLDGGVGADTLRGGNGSDVYIVDSISDRIELEIDSAIGGIDRVESSGSYQLGTGLENLTLTGFAPSSGTGNNLNNIIIGNDFDNQLWGNFGNDTLTGNGGIDRLDGGDGNDTLDGGDGNDTLDGGVGSDHLIGGIGNDAYMVDNATDIIVEDVNAGTDTVISSGTWTLGENLENLILNGADAINGTGNSLNNSISGNGADNTLDGGSGNDIINAGGGDDILVGGLGNDTLNGGAGSDRFVFNASNQGIDNITDFVVSDDTIEVSAAGFGGGLIAGAAIALDQFVIGSTSVDASDRFIYNSTNGALLFDADGTGAIAQIQIATLSTGLALTNADLVVI